ncbi:MAG: uracil phosphoribosyltransferase [Bdellovibrionales bacterium]|nr:uracil phosphoribosyltransferase [Bdellovibrionales bacterium]
MSEVPVKEFCHVVRHPVVQHKLCQLRDKTTRPRQFRELMEEVSQLLAYEVARNFELEPVDVETPMRLTKGHRISDRVVLVSIMRAGNGMLAGMQRLLSFAPVGHIGIYRDKFIKSTVEYYFRLPKQMEGAKVILLDPMLATGDTAVAAISRLKEYQVSEIRFVTIIASRPGLEKVHEWHPDVEIYTLSVEPEVNEMGYIVPGIGDAGDRLLWDRGHL